MTLLGPGFANTEFWRAQRLKTMYAAQKVEDPTVNDTVGTWGGPVWQTLNVGVRSVSSKCAVLLKVGRDAARPG